MIDTQEPRPSFEDWCKQLDEYHEAQRQKGVFEGYGPGSVVANTGAECWRDYYLKGICPADAMEEDRDYWGDE